ncbi:MAG: hypothetical protein Q8Q62_21945 [Mesorhizobium sp.]|nr:hypothetical protein [Mesorhizobium sp.]
MNTPKRRAGASSKSSIGSAGPGGMRRALADALPRWKVTIAGSLAWGMALGLSAVLTLLLEGWVAIDNIGRVGALYAAGGVIAFPPGLYLARLLSRARPDTAFTAAFFCFAVASIGATSLLFAMHYRLYYSTWHGGPFSIEWYFQFFFTTLAALYQFLVLGMRLFVPFGLLALFAVSLWHTRAKR